MRPRINGVWASVLVVASCAHAAPLPPTAVDATTVGGPAPLRTEICSHFIEPWSSDPLATRLGASPCMGPLDEQAARKRGFAYRMHYRGDVLVRVDRLTSRGRRDEGRYDCVQWTFERTQDRTEVECRDRAGRAPMRFAIEDEGRRVRILRADAQRRRAELRGFDIWERSFDDRGRATMLRFLREDGTPGLDIYGVHAYAYSYEDDGLTIVERAQNADRSRYTGLAGPEVARHRFEARGVGRSYEGLDHRLAPRDFSHGWYRWDRAYDAYGNETEVVFRNARGEVARLPCGHSGMAYVRDDAGQLVLETYLDANLAPRAACHRFARLRYVRDDLGRVTLKQYLTETDEPATTFYGASGYSFAYDGEDRIIERTSLGTDYQPHDTSRGFSVMRTEYGPEGTVARREFFHADGTFADVLILRCVFFAFDGTTGPVRVSRTESAAMDLAERARADLDRGVEFMEVVRRYSDTDGWLGPTTLAPPLPPFLAALAAPLEIGQRTGIERTPYGYYIIERAEPTIDLPPE